MAQINKPSDYFNTKLYTGNGIGSSRSLTGVGFKPDFVWHKTRSSSGNNQLYDVVRGAGEVIQSDNNSAEVTNLADGYLSSFDSDGFTMTDGASSDYYSNESGKTYATWNWLADNTSGSSNTDGSITSTVSANTTSGFSIGTYSGNSTTGATVGHGLGSAPSMVIVKKTNNVGDWYCYHSGIGATAFIKLNDTGASATNTLWNNTAPTSSVFSMDSNGAVNGSGDSYVFYAFAEKKGFSKFGSYTGNGNADGTFVYTGFKPAWVMFKGSSFSGENWDMYDNKRETFNVMDTTLKADSAGAESSNSLFNVDFLSNGIKLRNGHTGINQSGSTYIYMAFAEEPLVGDNPCTAR